VKLWNEIFVWTQQRVLNLINTIFVVSALLSCTALLCQVFTSISVWLSPQKLSKVITPTIKFTFMAASNYGREIKKRRSNCVSVVRPAVHTNTSRKRSVLKTLFKPEEF